MVSVWPSPRMCRQRLDNGTRLHHGVRCYISTASACAAPRAGGTRPTGKPVGDSRDGYFGICVS